MIEKVEYIHLLLSIITDKAYNTTLNIFLPMKILT